MPAFNYPAQGMYQHPLTPPEDLPAYTKEAIPSVQYTQSSYPTHAGLRRQDDRAYDYADRFGQHPSHAIPPPMLYPQAGYGNTVSSGPLPAVNPFYKPMLGPVLAPLRSFEHPHQPMHDGQRPNVHENHNRNERPVVEPKEEKPVGGVSAKLDYDMEIMTDFVVETANAIILHDRPINPSFRKWVHQVLSATRLPSATILLSFDYLSMRMRKQQRNVASYNEHNLYRMLTTALILGSKFLDDNTFINRSWSEVSTIPVAVLNYMEREWLQDMIFELHRDPNEPHGFESFRRRWLAFQDRKTAQLPSRVLLPLDTNVVPHITNMYSPLPQSAFSQPSPPPLYSAKPPQSAFPAPGYSRFGNSFVCRGSIETSPASAPHTGPTTPEYYGPQAAWTAIDNGNFGLASRLQAIPYQGRPQPQQLPSMNRNQNLTVPYLTPGYLPPPVYASTHGPECLCNSCNRLYMMAPSFGLAQPVVG